MSVLGTAKSGRLRRPVATITALAFAGIGLASPAFGADDGREPSDEITLSTTVDPTELPDDAADVVDESQAADGTDEIDVAPADDVEPAATDPTENDAEADPSDASPADADLTDAIEAEDGTDTDAVAALAEDMIMPFAVADQVTIDILSINDFHGRIAANGQSAGGAVLACAIDEVRAQNPNALFVSAGDNIGASTFTSFVANDQPTLDVLNEIGLDVSALGNHEFDQGRADVDDRILGAANFPHLSANIYDRNTGERAYDAFEIIERDGVRIGFIGAMTEDLPSLVSPAGIADLEVRSMAAEVNDVAATLTDGDDSNGEADVLIAVVHDGAAGSNMPGAADSKYGQLLAVADENIVAVISGHTHQPYAVEMDGMWVTQTGQYGEGLGHLSFTYDTATGELVDSDAVLIDLVDSAGVSVCAGDPAVQAIVDAAEDTADELGSEPLGTITADLNRALDSVGDENRGGESTLGNTVADVQLWAAQRTFPDAELAFMNPGGLRTDLKFIESAGEGDGVVTFKEAAEVQPFANTLVTTDLTGAQIIGVLEEQWQPAGASRPFLKLGVSQGLFYTYDPAAAAGEHIQDVWLNGEPLDLDANYTIVANSFLAAGGDNFATLAQGSATNDTGQSDLASMVDYFDEFGEISPDYQQRAVGLTWVSDPDAVYAAGDEIAIDVSSFTFSTNEPKPTELTTTLAGVKTESAAVDTSIVDTTDEVGRAEIRVMVPDEVTQGSEGAQVAATEAQVALVIADPVNGTEVMVPVLGAVEADEVTPPPAEPTPVPSPTPGGQQPGPGGGFPGGGELPRTGADGLNLALIAVLLLGAGTGLALKHRRVVRR